MVAVFGNRIWHLWTLGKLQTDPVLLNILLVQMLLGAFWYTSAIVPVAINKHEGIAKLILGASCLALALASLLPVPALSSLGSRASGSGSTVRKLIISTVW